MAISLGRTIGSPVFLLLQLVNMATGFLFVLCVVRLIMELHSSSLRYDGPKTERVGVGNESTALPRCFHIPLKSIFQQPTVVSWSTTGTDATQPSAADGVFVSGSRLGFFTMHVLTAVLVAPFLAVLVGRRKLVPDFVVTLYGLYLLLTNVMTGRFLGGDIFWWVIVVSGAAVLYGATWAICRHRELQDITLGSGTPQPQPVGPDRNTTHTVEFELEGRSAPQRRDRQGEGDSATTAVVVDVPGHAIKSKIN